MLNRIVNRLRGQVWVRVESRFPGAGAEPVRGQRNLALLGYELGVGDAPSPAASPGGITMRCAGP